MAFHLMPPEFNGFERTNSRDSIRNVVQTKAWYGLDPDTGAFNWQRSLENIALTLGLKTPDVTAAFTTAFTPSCLSRVSQINEEGIETERPLLEVLSNDGIKPYIWTMGDPAWQETKFARSGALEYVQTDHLICSPSHKIVALGSLIDRLSENGTQHVVVADDKPSNIDSIRNLGLSYRDKGVQIHDFLVKLRDKKADATALYEWIKLLEESTGYVPEVILDFDGVIADTDSVLFGPAIENLLKLVS